MLDLGESYGHICSRQRHRHLKEVVLIIVQKLKTK
jgi:hypothetical protein